MPNREKFRFFCLCLGVPQGCTSYTNFSDAERNVNYPATTSQCDTSLMGWYRFTDAAGLAMPDSCPREGSRCGASGVGWVNGNHPTAAEEVVTRPVCFSHGGTCCNWMGEIKVINCSGFYVYELPRTPTCSVRYCGTKVGKTNDVRLLAYFSQSPWLRIGMKKYIIIS